MTSSLANTCNNCRVAKHEAKSSIAPETLDAGSMQNSTQMQLLSSTPEQATSHTTMESTSDLTLTDQDCLAGKHF